jgi:hypothetical protein
VLSVSCRDVRSYLSGVAGGQAPTPPPGVWDELVRNGAVGGSPTQPTLTPVGRHVLSELEIRAYRLDAIPLERVADQLAKILSDMDGVARTAEYFLADLGPVTPAEALPLLRPVAVGLANRRETPEELAQEFRNAWGSVEVMGGDAQDRLLAAAIAHSSSVPMESLFSPMMATTLRLRERIGTNGPAVSAAALLHLGVGLDAAPPLDAFFAVRPQAGTDLAAALLATAPGGAEAALQRRNGFVNALSGGAPNPSRDAMLAATFLTTVGSSAPITVERVREIASALGPRFAQPLVPGAVLAERTQLAAAELVDWVDKATELAKARQLAPTPAELAGLGLVLVHGLPESSFEVADAGSPPMNGTKVSLPALVALNAWVYRPLIATTRPPVPAP